jgi:hypothetical protein
VERLRLWHGCPRVPVPEELGPEDGEGW